MQYKREISVGKHAKKTKQMVENGFVMATVCEEYLVSVVNDDSMVGLWI